MADRLEWFNVTVPANTPQTALYSQNINFMQGEVTLLHVKIPPGAAGNVGWYLTLGGTQAVPRTVGSFIITDDDKFDWELSNFVKTGQWSFFGYNTDAFPHVVSLGFWVNELTFSPRPASGGLVSV